MNRDFKGIWIPREIWLHQGISLHAKALWSEIYSLHNREVGGCYASDKYLMDFLGVKLSRLHEVIKELRDEGLIEKVSFNGRSRVIKALVPDIDYESIESQEDEDGGRQPSGKPEPCIPENRNPPFRNPGIPHYIEKSKDIREREREAKAPPPPPISSKIKKELPATEPKKTYFENVELSDKEYSRLLESYGLEKLKWMLAHLSAKIGANGYSYKSHYHVLLPANWVHKAYEEEAETKTKTKDVKGHREKVMERFKNGESYNGAECYITEHEIAFQRGQTIKTVKFKDFGFMDQLNNILRQFGIKT